MLLKYISLTALTELSILYTTYYHSAKRELRRYGCTSYIFDDLYQESFSLLIEKMKTTPVEIAYPYTYILRTCKYLWLKEQRSRRLFELTDELDQFQSEDAGKNIQREKFFQHHLGNLSASCREVLKLYFQGNSEEKISQLLNLGSYRVAKNRKYYCKEKLIDMMKNDPIFDELYG